MPATWIAPEEHAYPTGGQTRKGAALYPDGKVRRVWGGIPDTFYSIPAHGRIGGRYVAGFLTVREGTDGKPEWIFNLSARSARHVPHAFEDVPGDVGPSKLCRACGESFGARIHFRGAVPLTKE